MWKHTGQKRPDCAIEPGPEQESVWDYPRPPVIVPCSRRVRVKAGDAVIAESSGAVRMLETASPPTIYIAPDDIELAMLHRIDGQTTWCEWKGAATYWGIDGTTQAVGWSYPKPSQAFSALGGWLSFYPGRIECYLDDERVEAQAGGFYGGWITRDIVGPFKGEAGRGHW